MSARVYVDVPNIVADNIKELYAVVEMKDGMRVVSGGDIKVWATGRTAKWIKSEAVIDSHIFCSNCLTRCKDDAPTKYCPHCGFLMENESEVMTEDIIQTKNKKDLMLLDIINTGIAMCEQHNKLEDTLSYVRKSLEQLEESEKEVK